MPKRRIKSGRKWTDRQRGRDRERERKRQMRLGGRSGEKRNWISHSRDFAEGRKSHAVLDREYSRGKAFRLFYTSLGTIMHHKLRWSKIHSMHEAWVRETAQQFDCFIWAILSFNFLLQGIWNMPNQYSFLLKLIKNRFRWNTRKMWRNFSMARIAWYIHGSTLPINIGRR